MGFADGFRAGQGLVQAWQSADRQKVLDARAETAYNDGQADRKRLLGMRDQEDEAFAGYNNAAAGLDPAQQKTLQDTYGMNSGQVAAELRAGGAEGLRAKLAGYDMPDGGQAPMGTGFNASQLKTGAPDKVQMERMLGRVAAAKRDVAGMRESSAKVDVLEEDALMAKASKDPFTPEMLQGLNKTHEQVTMEAADKNGIRRFSVVNATGDALFGKLDVAQQGRLKGAFAIMERNPTRAWELIAGVNKDLAAYLKNSNDTTISAGDKNNDGQFRSGQLDNAADRNEIARSAAARAGGGGAPKVDQKFVAQLNDINQRINDATNPAEVKKLENEYRRVQSLAYTSMGKVAPLKESRADKPGAELISVPEDGKRVKDARGNVFTYQDGEPVMQGGVPRSGQAKAAASMGLPPEADSLMDWMPGGRHVTVSSDSDMVYDINTDKQLIQKALARVVQNNAAATELKAQGYAPRPNGPYRTVRVPRGMPDPSDPAMQRGAVMYPKP